MDQIEITAEVFKIIRANSEKRASVVMKKIKEHLPDVSNEQIVAALEELKK